MCVTNAQNIRLWYVSSYTKSKRDLTIIDCICRLLVHINLLQVTQNNFHVHTNSQNAKHKWTTWRTTESIYRLDFFTDAILYGLVTTMNSLPYKSITWYKIKPPNFKTTKCNCAKYWFIFGSFTDTLTSKCGIKQSFKSHHVTNAYRPTLVCEYLYLTAKVKMKEFFKSGYQLRSLYTLRICSS